VQDYRASLPELSEAGKVRRSQSRVVRAIRGGQQRACPIDKALMGETSLPRQQSVSRCNLPPR
jgi:hypothetical protein